MESLWIKTEKEILETKEQIEGEIEGDVCIVGGGITGITVGYYLSKAGKKVIIVDRENLAYKTTGYTTAKITSQHGLFYKYLIDNFSKEYAKKYYEANQEAIENIAKIVEEENIECDFKRQDAFVYTKSKKEVNKIKQEVEAVKEIGGKAEFIEKIEPPVGEIYRCNKI